MTFSERLKRPLSSGLERGLAASMRGLRPWVRTRVEPLPPAGRVLVWAPHPDDELAGCAGTLLEHAKLGDRLEIVVVSDGGASTSVAGDVGEIRRAEATEVARALGARLSWIGQPEGAALSQETRARLRAALAAARPAGVYAPSFVDFHPEHHRAARLLAELLSDIEPLWVRCFPVHVPLTPLLTNRVVDVSSHSDRIRELLALYPSQAGALTRTLRLRRYSGALHGAREAETFWELTPGEYKAVHGADHDRGFRFIGMRPNAFRDALAFVRGTRSRAELARLSRV